MGKFTAMLRFILRTQAKWSDDRERGVDLFPGLTAWEATVSDYIEQTGEPLSENIKESMLLEHAPEPYNQGRSFAMSNESTALGSSWSGSHASRYCP